jgi:hypothetical protein
MITADHGATQAAPVFHPPVNKDQGILDALIQAQDRTGLFSLCYLDNGAGPSLFDFEFHTVETLNQGTQNKTEKNTWISCARFNEKPEKGRGQAKDINALAMIPNDIDYKTGFTEESAKDYARVICERLRITPLGIVHTGHGIHLQLITDPLDPRWECNDSLDPRWSDMRTLMQRLRRYLDYVAQNEYNSTPIDNVYDLSRIMRAPIGTNWKDVSNPVEVTWECEPFGAWAPIGFQELSDALDTLGVSELAIDRDLPSNEPLVPAGEWEWAENSCTYSLAMVTGWAKDSATGDRHSWLMDRAVRLNAAHRRGCLTESNYKDAQQVLAGRFSQLITDNSPKGNRAPNGNEVADALRWGREKVESKTDLAVRKELRNHLHAEEKIGQTSSPDAPYTGTELVDPVTGEIFDPKHSGLAYLKRSELSTLPKPAPLIEDTVDLNTVILLAGTYGTLKSFVALDWLACIATGKNWQAREVKQGPVLYIAGEGVYGIDERLNAWEKAWKMKIPDTFYLVRAPIKLHEPRDFHQVQNLIKEIKPVLVVFDTLSRTAVGLEENSAKDMGILTDAAHRLRDTQIDMSVLLIHHTGKDKTTIRGSSALEANVDTVYLAEGTDTGITFKRTKRKDGPTGDLLRLKLEQIPGTDSAVIVSTGQVDTLERTRSLVSTLVSTFEHTGASKKDLEEATGLSRSTLARSLNKALNEGLVVNTGSDHRPIYKLSETVNRSEFI